MYFCEVNFWNMCFYDRLGAQQQKREAKVFLFVSSAKKGNPLFLSRDLGKCDFP